MEEAGVPYIGTGAPYSLRYFSSNNCLACLSLHNSEWDIYKVNYNISTRVSFSSRETSIHNVPRNYLLLPNMKLLAGPEPVGYGPVCVWNKPSMVSKDAKV